MNFRHLTLNYFLTCIFIFSISSSINAQLFGDKKKASSGSGDEQICLSISFTVPYNSSWPCDLHLGITDPHGNSSFTSISDLEYSGADQDPQTSSGNLHHYTICISGCDKILAGTYLFGLYCKDGDSYQLLNICAGDDWILRYLPQQDLPCELIEGFDFFEYCNSPKSLINNTADLIDDNKNFVEYYITTLDGKHIQSGTIENYINENSIISSVNLSRGIYILTIKNGRDFESIKFFK